MVPSCWITWVSPWMTATGAARRGNQEEGRARGLERYFRHQGLPYGVLIMTDIPSDSVPDWDYPQHAVVNGVGSQGVQRRDLSCHPGSPYPGIAR